MIEMVQGAIGGGKTYYAVESMLRHLARGGTVASNVRLNARAVIREVARRGVLISPDQIHRIDLNDTLDFHKRLPWGSVGLPVLAVLDEAHLFFNARDTIKTGSAHREVLSFFSQSRKACVDFILLAQVADTLDRQIRDQAEFVTLTRDMRRWRIPGWGRFPLPIMTRIRKDARTGFTISTEFIPFKQSVFRCYDTLNMLDEHMRRLESEAVRRPKLGRKVSLWSKCSLYWR